MKRMKCLGTAIVLFLLLTVQAASAQTDGDNRLANMSGGGSIVRWDVAAQNAGGTLTITTPDNRSLRKTFRAGGAPEISLTDKQLENLPDGVYTYELRLNPVLTPGQKEVLLKARGNDDDQESERGARKRPSMPAMVQSGAFSIVNGSIVVAGVVENQRTGAINQPRGASTYKSANTVSRLFNHRVALGAMFDQVIPDDLIVQGSECVGLDCVNNESFSFDTIRLKENNTRISFNDTSTAAGFPTNDWTIRANSSSSGGANFLAFVDRGSSSAGDETGTIVFEVDAGANANSFKVSSNSKIGLRTATPVLDVHMNTGDTPAIRFEQNNGGGFTAQTWDIGANEANWFVRDVTGGSRLPFRIRPGAPTSSIDITASGRVGVGQATATTQLDILNSVGAFGDWGVRITGTSTAGPGIELKNSDNSRRWLITNGVTSATDGSLSLFDITASQHRLIINSSGNVGIATTSPTDTLSVNGTASKTGGGSWSVFSDERLKNIRGHYTSGLSAVMRLQPLRYSYKADNVLGLKADQEYIGFGAQSLQQVIPEAVTKNANGFLQVNNDPIIWTMLNAIKEQQKEIADLKSQLKKLQTGKKTRRR